MKIVQTYWTYPMLDAYKGKADDLRLNGGWPSRLYNYFSWAYSSLLLREHYEKLELVTDKLGKEILIDKLNLPYTQVVTELDDLNMGNTLLWALGKLHAYSIQDEPFIHIDGDIFIYKKFSQELTSAEILGQNIETGFRDESQVEYATVPDYLHALLEKGGHLKAINVGIFGGTNLPAVKAYVREAHAFIDKNYKQILSSQTGTINAVYEQVLLYYFLAKKNVPVKCLFPPHLNFPRPIGDFHRVPDEASYIHLIGTFKQSFYHYKTMEKKLAAEYPDCYKNIVELYNNMEI